MVNKELRIYNEKFKVIKKVDRDTERYDICSFIPKLMPGVHYYVELGAVNDIRFVASIIKIYGSYGYEDDLWELGLFMEDVCDKTGRGFYLLGIASDGVPADGTEDYIENTVGCLTEEEVNQWLEKLHKKFVLKKGA